MALAAAVLVSVFSPAAAKPRSEAPAKEQPNNKPPTRLLVRSGTLISGDGAPIQLRAFEADIANQQGKKNSDQVESKVVLIKTGDAFISNDSLSKLLTGKLKDHNMEDIQVSNDKGQVKITGKAKKGITVPFTIEGPVSLTNTGQIRLEMTKEKVAHLPKGLTQLLGLDPEKMAGDGKVKGVSMDQSAIQFDPDLLWALPVHGRVTKLNVQNNGLLLIFGGSQKPVLRAKNTK